MNTQREAIRPAAIDLTDPDLNRAHRELCSFPPWAYELPRSAPTLLSAMESTRNCGRPALKSIWM